MTIAKQNILDACNFVEESIAIETLKLVMHKPDDMPIPIAFQEYIGSLAGCIAGLSGAVKAIAEKLYE